MCFHTPEDSLHVVWLSYLAAVDLILFIFLGSFLLFCLIFFSDTSVLWEFAPFLGAVWLFSQCLYGAERSVSALCHSYCRVGYFLQGKCMGLKKSPFKVRWA